MNNSYKEQHEQTGFLVIDELPISILQNDFIKLLTPTDEYPSFVFVDWLKQTGEKIQISLLSAKHMYSDGKQTYLYSLPEAIDRAIGIEYLEGSVKIIGFLVLIDIKRLLDFGAHVDKSFSAIHRAKKYNLPIIIVVINSQVIKGSIERLSQFIDFLPDMPIVWHDGDIDLDLVNHTMDIIHKYI